MATLHAPIDRRVLNGMYGLCMGVYVHSIIIAFRGLVLSGEGRIASEGGRSIYKGIQAKAT